ncbi:alpha/beta fold hydrolase [Streptomonospora salina]|uniref:Pimeloyl-ACP methyl ester carboxylesterase n=1 Tax=Streptomonospora salina TaxID=104205 RepID=A0A841ED38_9ACTN|nr:alpha/beta hydrolase [Streptomonospora salina]MBB6001045.1 pimeloyl-ACP methyl ester carboxylesterase [Streptomonospora salina]
MPDTLAPDTEALTLRRGDLEFDALAAGPADGPLVLFLHGFPEFATCWRRHLAAAGRAGYRAVAVDQRGYSPGARPLNTADYTVAELVGDVTAFADELGAERFHLVGHDWGGVLGWPTAARHADRVASLTVLSTPHPAALAAALASSPEQRTALSYIRLFQTPGAAEESLLDNGAAGLTGVYEGRVPEDLVADNVRRLSQAGALTAALNWYRAMELEEGSTDAPAISVPTLYVWSTEDVAFTAQAARGTGEWVAGPYRFVELDGFSHWLPEEAPEQTVEPLLEHLAAAERG